MNRRISSRLVHDGGVMMLKLVSGDAGQGRREPGKRISELIRERSPGLPAQFQRNPPGRGDVTIVCEPVH
jgi:hypothetical protein